MVPVTARHPSHAIEDALAEAGVDPETVARRVMLGWPRRVVWEGWVRFGLPRLPNLGGAELVHAPSVAVPPRSGVPLVVTVHDAAPALFPDAFTKGGLRFHQLAFKAVRARADLVITVSRAAAEEVAAHLAVPPERIRVVPNAVDPPEMGAEECRAFLRARGLEGREYVLWVGSLEPRKGVETLVAAMAELRRRAPKRDVLLVLAGYEGWLNTDLIDPDHQAVLGAALRQLGRVGDRELWALYRGARLSAFPSRHEGFGLPVVEAMSQGVAVVASDIAAVREVSGGAACLVPVGDVKGWADALGHLLSDEGERRRLAEAGRARSQAFNAPAMAAATRAVYEEALGSS